jgi:phage gpG-like protein
MSAPITITGQVLGAERVTARFLNAAPKVRARVSTEVMRLGLELLRKVKSEKLTGQALNVRTGRLRRSINHRLLESADTIQSRVGTNVSYGRRHELGFKGAEQVKQHLRKIKQAFGRPIAPTVVTVGAFTRTANTPARPFLQPSLAEMKDEIRRRLLVAATGGI